MRQKTGTRSVVRVEEFPHAAYGIALAGKKVLMILRGQKCRQVMIEPPCDLGRRRVFEVNNRVLVTREIALVKESARPMHLPVIIVGGVLRNALAIEPRKQRCGSGPGGARGGGGGGGPRPRRRL